MRILPSLLLALFLLFGQQSGALHALGHVFAEKTEQQNKQTPHSIDCEKCLGYAQLGSALNSTYFSFDLNTFSTREYTPLQTTFITRQAIPAKARGPPQLQRLA